MKKKKGCCLFTLIKWVLILLGVLFVLMIYFVMTEDSQPTASQTTTNSVAPNPTAVSTKAPTQAPTVAPTKAPDPTSVPQLEKPGIDGSNAYDVIIGLEGKGIKQPETEITSDGFRWTSRSVPVGDTVMHYDIESNKKYEITRAFFTMNGENNGFIAWIGTLPHDASDSSIVDFIKKSISDKKTGSLTVGDCIWGVIVGPNGIVLQIQDVEAEDYAGALLDQLQ